jgi:hypothetical protein
MAEPHEEETGLPMGTTQKTLVGENYVIEAGTSITLKCGASSIHMNQAGFITISGMVISVAGGVTCTMAAPVTTVVGGILMTTTGAVNVSTGAVNKISGRMLASVTGGVTDIKGDTVNINC